MYGRPSGPSQQSTGDKQAEKEKEIDLRRVQSLLIMTIIFIHYTL